jgi:hypothetical protein
MKTIFDHIEHIKGKPHHIRKQVAFGVAALSSAFVALVWLVSNYAMGTFAIQGSNFAMSSDAATSVTTTTRNVGSQGLAGVGAATVLTGADAPAHIEIVDTAVVAPAKKQVEQTTIPF